MSLKIHKPQGQAWMDESESVFDAPGENLMRSLAKLVMPGPEDVVQPTMTGPVAPLVTIFKDKAARALATQGFIDKMADLLPGNWSQAASEFAERYPRVAAHISPSLKGGTRDAAQVLPRTKATEPIGLNITTTGQDMGMNDIDTARRLMFEEGTHVAQGLGNRHTDQLYTLADRSFGYEHNPFELSAKETADRWANRLGGHGDYPPAFGGQALSMLKDAVQYGAGGKDKTANTALKGYFARKAK